MKINFVTTNEHKFKVAETYLSQLSKSDIELVQCKTEAPEIQDKSTEAVARYSALWLSRHLGEAAIAADTGFCITALNGFPGPFLKYINEWLETTDILALMQDKKDRGAYFIDALAYAEPSGESTVFSSETHGKIIMGPEAPNTEWTIDGLFIPDGYNKTLAELDEETRIKVWDVSRWNKLVKYLEEKNG